VARHEARGDRDLDLLATFGPTDSLFDLIRFERDHSEVLSMKVEGASDRGPKDRIRATVPQGAVPL
jgi:predicted nucleotidyltransferase